MMKTRSTEGLTVKSYPGIVYYKFTVIALPQKTQRTFLKEMRFVFLNISGNIKMDKLFNMANMEMYHQSTFTKHFRKH